MVFGSMTLPEALRAIELFGKEIMPAFAKLDRDDFSSNRHPDLASCLSMIFSENRFPLFGIML